MVISSTRHETSVSGMRQRRTVNSMLRLKDYFHSCRLVFTFLSPLIRPLFLLLSLVDEGVRGLRPAVSPARNAATAQQHSGRESRRTVNSRLRLKDTFHRSRPLSTSCRGQAPSRTNTRQDNFKTTVTSPGPPSFGPRHPCTLTLLRY